MNSPIGGNSASARRNIILFADGTGNSSRSAFKSNVWRLYEAIDSGPPPADDPVQLVHYIDGVGTSSFRWLAYLGQAFGFGLARKVKALYEFLCRHYEPGDHIYVFGFSRGAFTARVLVDLIASCGIIDRSKPAPHKPDFTMEQERGFRLGIDEAYRTYRHKYWSKAPLHLNLINAIWERVILTARKVWRDKEPFHSPESFMKKFAHEPADRERKALRCIGVFDTVDAYGMPVREIADLIDRLIYPYQFRDQQLNPLVHRALQALSLDDKRKTFHPLLWDERLPGARAARLGWMQKMGNAMAKSIRPGGDRGKSHEELEARIGKSYEGIDKKSVRPDVDPRIRQVWFAGMHADVGGGYPEYGLAMVTADWMAKEVTAGAEADGVKIKFKPDHLAEFENSRQATGHLHDSRAGAAAYFRYGPRDVDTLCGNVYPNPKLQVVLPKVHRSVFDRVTNEKVGYAPVGLPKEYEITEWQGAAETPRREIPDEADARMGIQGRNWNHIFWRVFTYYGMLFPTLVLLALPALRWLAPDSIWPYLKDPNVQENVVSKVLGVLGGYLSKATMELAEYWTPAWIEAPSVFLGMLLFGLFCFVWSGWFIQRNVQHISEAALRNLRRQPWTPLWQPAFFERLANWLANGGGIARLLRSGAECLYMLIAILILIGLVVVVVWVIVSAAMLIWNYAGPLGSALLTMFSKPAVWVLLVIGLVLAGIGSSSRSA
jgi:uncharacterized protein (DUF2235 family)